MNRVARHRRHKRASAAGSEPLERRLLLSLSAAGDEFRVNTFTNSDQSVAVAASDADGDFIVAWDSFGQDGSSRGIYAQRFNAAGTPQGVEFRANTFTTGDQRFPAVAMDGDGDFVIAWDSAAQDGSGFGIFAQRYSATGVPQGVEFRVNTTTAGEQGLPGVAMDASGGFVVIWRGAGSGDDYGVYARRYNAAGVAQGGEFLVNTFTAGTQRDAAVAMDAGGDFVIAWGSTAQDPDGTNGVYAQRYDALGAAQGAEFRVNTTTAGNQSTPSVAVDAGGDFVIAWTSAYDIFARRYNAAGVDQGGEFRVNPVAAGFQEGSALAMDADGEFLVAWSDATQFGPEIDVLARSYSAAGVAQDDPFRVNTFTPSLQAVPSVAMDADGNAVVAWHSNAQDGSLNGVYAQRYAESNPDDAAPLATDASVGGNRIDPGERLAKGVAAVVLNFSEDMSAAGGADSATNPANYGLTRNGADVSSRIASADFAFNAVSNKFEATLTFAPALDAGVYVVSARDSLRDVNGNALDGDADGSPGGNYFALPFTVELADKLGPEFQVNTAANNNQFIPAVAADADGDFVVAWTSNGQDGDGFGVYAQRYDANGNRRGGEFQVNTTTASNQSFPAVAMEANGDFVIAWDSFATDGSFTNVFARRYNAAGTALGVEFRVSQFAPGHQRQPSAAMDADGDFIIAWESDGPDGDGFGVFARRYNAAGTAVTNDFRINTFTAGNQENVRAAMDASGDFVVTWTSEGQDPDGTFGVYARRYSAGGVAQGIEFRVNTTVTDRQSRPAVSMDDAGDFVVAWISQGQDPGNSTGIYAQRFDAAGVAQGGEFRVNSFTFVSQIFPAVSMDADGDFVVAWHSQTQDPDGSYGVYAQRYDAEGLAQGPEFRVNTFTADFQSFAAVATDDQGEFVIAWDSTNQDGSGRGIYAQRFGLFGTVGPETPVNTFTTSNQEHPDVAVDADGDFVVVWDSYGSDGSRFGVAGRRYTAAGVALGAEFQVNTFAADSQGPAAVASDADGDFVVVWTSSNQEMAANQEVYGQRYSAAGQRRGQEFRVNTTTNINQQQAAVAMDADGDFVVAWASQNQDQPDGSFGVFAQRYDADGVPLGGEFRVHTTVLGAQSTPGVAMDAVGNFVIAWTSDGQDGAGVGIFTRRFGADGVALTGEIPVNQTTAGNQFAPRVASDADGDFIVTWTDDSGRDGNGRGVFARRFDAAGTPVSDEFQVNTFTTNTQSFSDVAMDVDGDFVVTWQDYIQDGSQRGVYAQRYDRDGFALGGEFRVNTATAGTQQSPAVCTDADGDFVIAFQGVDAEPGGIFFQRHEKAGDDAGPVVADVIIGGEHVRDGERLVQAVPSIVLTVSEDLALPRGDFILSVNGVDMPTRLSPGNYAFNPATNKFEITLLVDPTNLLRDGAYVIRAGAELRDNAGNRLDGDFDGAPGGADFARAFTIAEPVRLDPEFKVNGTADAAHRPAVASDPDGNFIVAWERPEPGGSVFDVYARRFTAAGVPLGDEFRVNTTTANNQRDPAVAVDADGDFVIVWTSTAQDEGGSFGVYAKRYSSAGNATSGEVLVNTSTFVNQVEPAVAIDAGGDNFVVVWQSPHDLPTGYDIYFQRFNRFVNKRGVETRVNSVPAGRQIQPAVAMDADGEFVVAWTSYADVGAPRDVFARQFSSFGVPRGGDFRVNTNVPGDQDRPSVASDGSGDFVVAWQSNGQDGGNPPGYGVYAQRYSAAAAPQGGEVLVNVTTDASQRIPSVSMDVDGDFVVAWTSRYQDGAFDGIYARRYSAAGTTLTSEFRVNTTSAGDQVVPAVAADADGDFVVAWVNDPFFNQPTAVFAQRYGANQAPTTGGITPVRVLQNAPDTVLNLRTSFADSTDPDELLTFSVVGNTNPSLFSSTPVNNGNGNLTLDYASGQNGQATLTVRATDTGGLFVDTQLLVTIDPPGPRVTAVFLDSSAWAPAFRNFIQSSGLGLATRGFRVLAGVPQLDEMPWVNVDRFHVVFSQDVNVDAADLAVRGVNVAGYPLAANGGFSYDPAAFTATWTLAAAVSNDKVLLDLNADEGGVTDKLATPRALDGDWTNGVAAYPSGNGGAGGDFRFQINVLPGDANRSGGIVNALDLQQVRIRQFTSPADPGTPPNTYTVFYDVNGSAGIINAVDVQLVRIRQFSELPTGNPTLVASAPVPRLAATSADRTRLADDLDDLLA